MVKDRFGGVEIVEGNLASQQHHKARKWGFHKGHSPFGEGTGVSSVFLTFPPKDWGIGGLKDYFLEKAV